MSFFTPHHSATNRRTALWRSQAAKESAGADFSSWALRHLNQESCKENETLRPIDNMTTSSSSHQHPHNENLAESHLCSYLESISAHCNDEWVQAVSKRTQCPVCSTSYSKSLYCERCFRLLIPTEYWPRSPPALLPYAIDIIFDDQMTTTTGVHYKVLWDAMHPDKADQCRVFNYDRGKGTMPPTYDNEEGTYLLFPSDVSVPLSSIEPKSRLRRLVVLDCKWVRTTLCMRLACIVAG